MTKNHITPPKSSVFCHGLAMQTPRTSPCRGGEFIVPGSMGSWTVILLDQLVTRWSGGLGAKGRWGKSESLGKLQKVYPQLKITNTFTHSMKIWKLMLGLDGSRLMIPFQIDKNPLWFHEGSMMVRWFYDGSMITSNIGGGLCLVTEKQIVNSGSWMVSVGSHGCHVCSMFLRFLMAVFDGKWTVFDVFFFG